MGKQIVGRFDNKFNKIEFFEVVANYKEYTVLRKQGTKQYFIWDNQYALLSDTIELATEPEKAKDYADIIAEERDWFYGNVFFWADSKFVSEFGFPHYDELKDIYKQLVKIRHKEHRINETIQQVRNEEGFFTYLKYTAIFKKFMRRQRKSIKMLIKEFKVIW